MEHSIENMYLSEISKEIEETYNCKVLNIRFVQLISLCVDFKIQFNEDFLYQPFDELPKPEIICFSTKTASFYKRVDLFECMKKTKNLN